MVLKMSQKSGKIVNRNFEICEIGVCQNAETNVTIFFQFVNIVFLKLTFRNYSLSLKLHFAVRKKNPDIWISQEKKPQKVDEIAV